jgi:glutamine synthetase
MIAAGLDGIDRELDPGDPCELNLLKLTEQGSGSSAGWCRCP